MIERLVGEVGYTLRLDHTVDFTEIFDGQTLYWIPDRLWLVDPRLCFSKVKFPDAVAHRENGEWQLRYLDLADRDDQRRVYQYLLGAGIPVWIWRWVDGAPPRRPLGRARPPPATRTKWQPLVDHARNGPQEVPIDIAVDDTLKNRNEDQLERIATLRADAAERVKARSKS